jgi:hypothetical protein
MTGWLTKVQQLRVVGGGVQTGSTRHRAHLLSYCACPGWLWGWRIIRRNKDWQGKPKYSEKTCPSATLSTTNPTWPDPGFNAGRRGGKPATNRLSYDAAKVHQLVEWEFAGETDVTGGNSPQCQFVHQYHKWLHLVSDPGLRVGNRISAGSSCVESMEIHFSVTKRVLSRRLSQDG